MTPLFLSMSQPGGISHKADSRVFVNPGADANPTDLIGIVAAEVIAGLRPAQLGGHIGERPAGLGGPGGRALS
jgi:hypothetical protein